MSMHGDSNMAPQHPVKPTTKMRAPAQMVTTVAARNDELGSRVEYGARFICSHTPTVTTPNPNSCKKIKTIIRPNELCAWVTT